MKLSATAHTDQPWRIHEIAPAFRVEDVWALPVVLGPDDFPELVQLLATYDPGKSGPLPVRALFAIRWKLGALLRLDTPESGVGSRVPTLRDRLPADLCDARPTTVGHASLPFSTLYLTDDEWAAEIANATVHGLLHIGRIANGDGTYRAQLAVLVKPNGRRGDAYLAMIKPFRHLLVYPAMIRQGERLWRERRLPPVGSGSRKVG